MFSYVHGCLFEWQYGWVSGCVGEWVPGPQDNRDNRGDEWGGEVDFAYFFPCETLKIDEEFLPLKKPHCLCLCVDVDACVCVCVCSGGRMGG